jgi:hypothetical protein
MYTITIRGGTGNGEDHKMRNQPTETKKETREEEHEGGSSRTGSASSATADPT